MLKIVQFYLNYIFQCKIINLAFVIKYLFFMEDFLNAVKGKRELTIDSDLEARREHLFA